MFKKRHVLPIFLLYFLTSVAFLVFFGKVFYDREKHFIMDKDAFDFRDFKRELQIKLHNNGELDDDDFDDMKAYVVNLKTGEVIEDDFKPKQGMARNYMDGEENVVQFRVHDKKGQNEYLVAIKRADVKVKLLALKAQILLVSLGVLAAILLIAYLIIRLSLRPLYAKIEFLDGFIRDTTHEINTPLSVILMSIELFKTDPEKYLGNIKTAAHTISNLYEDLTILRLNKKYEENEEVNLAHIVSERLEFFSLNLKQKGINLTVDIKDVTLVTSKFKVRKIVDNLLSNAVKYSNEGGSVSVKLDKKALIITNSGQGISKENLPHIFDLYTRFDEANGGFGIGLNIVKKFCDELKFKISCKSGNGTTEFKVAF
ncbi:HAMP domain-containing sensor histidine kinase [Campylobacter sp. RM16188]|uniref:sensor histidine kinase n=1 Tax=Campylobacter sp. RM16188 TaxID=1705725 RepID=UPI0015560710|nr:HAMP domain-containing sensor histidine kinase [Campylobacter sp. RM16188]